MADEKSEPERLTMDDLAALRRLIPAARIELERQERTIAQLNQTNERYYDIIITALQKFDDLGLHNLSSELREKLMDRNHADNGSEE
jgi:RNase P protein component